MKEALSRRSFLQQAATLSAAALIGEVGTADTRPGASANDEPWFDRPMR